VTPLPPEPGELGRVRRRALVRRLRGPASAAVSGALVAVALAVVPSSQSAADRIVPADDEPALVQTYTPEPEPTTSPTASPTPSPTPAVTAEPSESELPESDGHDGHWPTATATPTPTRTWDIWNVCAQGGPRRFGPDVSGVVVDRRGKPVPNIRITGSRCDGQYFASGVEVARTGADGTFSFPCLKEWAVAAPFVWYRSEFPDSTDAPVGFGWLGAPYSELVCGSTHRVVLPDEAVVTVQLVDDEGKPLRLAGDHVGIHMEVDQATNFDDAVTDAEGRVTFRHLAPGRYSLYVARYEGGHWSSVSRRDVWFTVAEGGTATASIAVAPPANSTATPTTSPSATATPSATTVE
jgi:hypothetical protein